MSNLTAFNYIGERSEATPGLWNAIFSQLSENIATLDFTSGGTTSISSGLSIGNDLWVKGQVISGQDASITTRTLLSLGTNSNVADYIRFSDTSASRSAYIIGSHVGGTADGLNIWDDSSGTMIASFSKQSIRFYQNVVGPVFDVGGALADTYNAATFGTGADSTESRIQAAIDQASIDGISRVYVPANMYPYSASSVSFIHTVQMIREGGDAGHYDIVAYGANGDGSGNQYAAIQNAFNAAGTNRNIAFIPQGRFRITSKISMPSNLEVAGAGHAAVLYFAWFFVSGATSGGDVYMFNNKAAIAGSHNTAIRLHDFAVEGDNTTGLPTGLPTPDAAAGILLRKVVDVDIARLRVTNVPAISIAYQGVSNARFVGNYVSGGGHDGITGGSFGTWPCSDVVVANNNLGPLGDDGIAVNKSVDEATPGDTRPTRISVVGNTIFSAVSNHADLFGRGILLKGVEHVTCVGNSIGSTFAPGILVLEDNVTSVRAQYVTLTGNAINGCGQVGDGSQSPNGIQVDGSDFVSIVGNVISNGSTSGLGCLGSTYVSIVGNSVISNGKQMTNFGIDCSTSTNTNMLIADNVIKGNSGAGIHLNLIQGAQVRGNTIIDNGSVGTGALDLGSGILIQGTGGQAPFVEITNNHITDTRAAANKTQSYGVRGNATSSATYFIVNNRLSGNSGAGVNVTGTPNTLIQSGNLDYDIGIPGTWIGHWSPSAFTGGTALLPGMSFSSERSLGWYWSGVSTMGLSYGTLLLNSIIRQAANSSVLPTARFLSGANNAQLGLGRTGNDLSLVVANANGAFLTGTRTGDVGMASASTVSMLFAITATPLLSLVTLNGRPRVTVHQSGVFSVRTLAASSVTASAANTNMAPDEMLFTVGGASGASLALYSGGTVYIFDSTLSAKAT